MAPKSKLYEQYIIRNPSLLPVVGNDLINYSSNNKKEIGITGLPIVWSESRLIKGCMTILEAGIVRKDMMLPSGPGQVGKAHVHDYDEIFFFTGMNPDDITELGAEIEYWVGEDDKLEKLVFDTSSCLYMPAGLAHHPMIFKNVKKPIFFITIMLGTADRHINPASQKGRPTV
jgi:hypothetical protein